MPLQTDVANLSTCRSRSSLCYWFSSWYPLTFVPPISMICYDSPTKYIMYSEQEIYKNHSSGAEIPLISSRTYSFVIVKILFKSFSCLRVNAFVRNIRILLVTWAFVILATMCFPIPKTHPAEIVFTIVTLHVIATTVFLNADVTLWTLQNINYVILYILI